MNKQTEDLIEARREKARAERADSRPQGPTADYMPQGYCPKPWVARVDGKTLKDARGGARRYSTEEAALKAARAAHAAELRAIGGEG